MSLYLMEYIGSWLCCFGHCILVVFFGVSTTLISFCNDNVTNLSTNKKCILLYFKRKKVYNIVNLLRRIIHYRGIGGSSAEYHPEFQDIASGSNPHPNNMLGHYFWTV